MSGDISKTRWWTALWKWISGGAGHREDFDAANKSWQSLAVTMRQDFQEWKAEKNEELKGLKTECRSLRVEVDECRDDRATLHEKCATLETDSIHVKEELRKCKDGHEKCDEKTADLTKQVEEMKRRMT